jgi:hypothetical protein
MVGVAADTAKNRVDVRIVDGIMMNETTPIFLTSILAEITVKIKFKKSGDMRLIFCDSTKEKCMLCKVSQ